MKYARNNWGNGNFARNDWMWAGCQGSNFSRDAFVPS